MNLMIPDDNHGKIRRVDDYYRIKVLLTWMMNIDVYNIYYVDFLKLFSFWIYKILKYEEQK